ncbi:MAG: hypothetical protein PHS84_06480 [Paludibacter sp.]|nr:hypothetical protein [Paludibacter sp.]
MKQYLIVAFCIFISMSLSAQGNSVQDKITLKTGEIYVGKIVLKTNDMIMLNTIDGTRYQFQLSEIEKMETETKPNTSKVDKPDSIKTTTYNYGNFGGLVELSGGISNAKNSFGWSPNTQLSLIFGNKNLLGKNLFGGIGIGYNYTFLATSTKSIEFLPLFVHIRSSLKNKRTSPYFGMDIGYAFALNTGNSGGSLIKISAGLSHKISLKTIFFAGIYAGVQTFSGILTETNSLGSFTYTGETSMNNLGLKAGIQF